MNKLAIALVLMLASCQVPLRNADARATRDQPQQPSWDRQGTICSIAGPCWGYSKKRKPIEIERR